MFSVLGLDQQLPHDLEPRLSMLGALGALVASAKANQNMNLSDLSRRQASLCVRLRKFDFVAMLEVLAGLLTRPANHAATLRIEALIHLAALHSRGRQKPTLGQVREWLNEILAKDALGHDEDPVEDVFVTNAPSFDGNARIFEGAWEDAAAHLADVAAALLRLKGRTWADRVLEEVMALLRLSEAIAERASVPRYSMGQGLPHHPVAVSARTVEKGHAAVVFTIQELLHLGLAARDLRPFQFEPDMMAGLAQQTLGHTALERRPLVRDQGRLIVALPTALSAAARRHVLESAQAAGELGELAAALEAVQVQDLALALMGSGVSLTEAPRTLAPGIVAVAGTFDEGGYAVGILVSDDLEEVVTEGLQSVANLMTALDEPVSGLEQEFTARPNYRRGLTIIARGGVGRGYAAGFSDELTGWRRTSVPLSDLLRLSWDHEFSAARVWKVLEQEDALETKGYELGNLNGFLNLYSYLEQTQFNFVPPDLKAPGVMALATDYVAPLRTRLRKALDQHLILAPDRSRWVEVQRRATDVFFEELRDLPLYVSHLDALNGQPLGCFETAQRPWWVGIAGMQENGDARAFSIRIWDAAMSWLVRLAPRLETELPDLPPGPLSIRLEFPDIADWGDGSALPGLPRGEPVISFDADVLVVRSDVAALRAYSEPTNVGERLLIAAISRGAAERAGAARDPAWADALAREIMGSDAARFVHAIPASNVQEMIQAGLRLPRARLVAEEDLAWARLGLAAAAGRPSAGTVPDAEAGAVLQTAVLRLWERILGRLQGLERRSVVMRALLNHEAVGKDRSEWKQTASALLALHHDQADVVRANNERETARAAAGTASRALVEMAICACPTEGGRACTAIDLDELMADLAVMLDCAGQCDAYHYSLAEAPLAVAANGSFVFDLGFLHALHLPYLYAHQERAFRDVAEDYAEAFEQLREDTSDREPTEPPEGFLVAVRSEYGMSAEDLIAFTFETAESALESGEPILVLPRSVVLARLSGGDRKEAVDADKAFAALTLRPRSRWDEPEPSGARARDWQPWRMNRKLSLIRRPLVQLDDAADPPVVLTPGLLDRAIRRMFDAIDGRLPAETFDSRAMERWIGGVVDERGHAFNRQVAEELRRLGFQARADVQLTELGGAKSLGDVDVLAWSPDDGTVWLIECKRLLMDRTVGEIGARLADYTTRGLRNGKRTPIQKHLDRVTFLSANPGQLVRLTGITLARLHLRSALVTDAIVPMQFTERMSGLVDRVCDYRGLKTDFAAI